MSSVHKDSIAPTFQCVSSTQSAEVQVGAQWSLETQLLQSLHDV